MKKIFFAFFVFAFLFSIQSVACAATPNVGMIDQPIWFSQDPLVEGDTVSIYTIVYNGESKTLAGTVEFYDSKTLLGSRPFSISAKTTKDVSVTWKVTAGSHSIYARIVNPTFVDSHKNSTPATGADTETKSVSVTVSKKAAPGEQEATSETKTAGLGEGVSKSISDAQEFFSENIPDSVKNIAAPLETFRVQNTTVLDAAKKDTQIKVKAASTMEAMSTTDGVSNQKDIGLKQPLLYVKLFFVTLLVFIFGSPFLFYAVFVLVVFFALRKIWSLFRSKKD